MVWIQVRNGITRPGRGSRAPDLASKVKGWGLDLDFILDYITAESNSLAAVSMERSGNNWTWQCCKVGMQDATGELATFTELWKYDYVHTVTFSLFITSKLCILWLFCGTQHSKSARRIDASSFLSLEIILEVWRWARYHLYILLKIKSGTSLAVLYCNKDYRSHASINVSLLILSLFRNCVVTGSLRFTIRITFANSLWTHRSVSGKNSYSIFPPHSAVYAHLSVLTVCTLWKF